MNALSQGKLRICMVSDFFFPNCGGVENHIYQLCQCLLNKGHKVVVITHNYGDRKGIRFMNNGLKIYYIPLLVIYNQCTLPTLFASFPLIRYILIREKIDIVHSHSAFSALAIETLIHSSIMGLKTVFTDHSLFGFADASAIITNQLLSMALTLCNLIICVSHIGKENTALRGGIPPNKIYVIPNAVDNEIFTPDPSQRSPNKVTIIVLSRLVYRKGIDLLLSIIPVICKRHSYVNFIIVGDGPKRVALEEVVEDNHLQERVTFLGSVKHEKVRNILVKGHIFLNSSLTEAFCMAIVEAASCGLQIVSTNVGGIPEVLPKDMIWLTNPDSGSLIDGIERALKDYKGGNVIDPYECHRRIKKYYQWKDVSQRTLNVYYEATKEENKSLGFIFKELWKRGSICDVLFIFILAIESILNFYLNKIIPKETIDFALEL